MGQCARQKRQVPEVREEIAASSADNSATMNGTPRLMTTACLSILGTLEFAALAIKNH